MEVNSTDKPLATCENWINFYNSHRGGWYIEGTNLYVKSTRGYPESLIIGDVSNAYKRGKECHFYTLTDPKDMGIFPVLEMYNYDPQAVYDACEALNAVEGRKGSHLEHLEVWKRSKKGVNTFSPYLLDRLKPLTEIPAKWRISHAIRMLANNQFEDLRTENKLTDDYAFDAAVNYQKGTYPREALLCEMVESPSGWWISDVKEDGQRLGINCHSFDYKDCIVRLNGAETKQAQEVDEIIDVAVESLPNTPPPVIPLKPAGILMLS